ncbi:MAG: DNA repair protein RadA [Nitrospina sp.]|nr:DNA repair protein RadA [Nitrospina sp.]
MARNKTEYVCQSCGHRAPKWLGKCPECHDWNTLAEEAARPAGPATKNSRSRSLPATGVVSITDVTPASSNRVTSGIGELDRVLGGGLVPGSLILLGGDPGIGKSTLVLQSLFEMARAGMRVLYVSGEESPEQIQIRASRLNRLSENFRVFSEICLEDILPALDRERPAVLVLDSIQTFHTIELQSAPGSVGQVREVAFRIFQECKGRGLPVWIIGHITKDGAIAGPKSLEHIVDTVLYFEGERGNHFRILRAIKNRFGATPEMGVFEMRDDGLSPVANPSEIFLAERPAESPGSVIVATLEGTRSLLVEVQALVSSSSSVGMPRRMASGVDPNRLSLLVAILEKRLGLHLQGEDIFVNIAGGLKVTEPAIDLGLAAAVASSFRNRAIDPSAVVIGEVGLTGEVRSVGQLEARLQEAGRLGFTRCILPRVGGSTKLKPPEGLRLEQVATLEHAFDLLFE